jgi:hypothetical protein
MIANFLYDYHEVVYLINFVANFILFIGAAIAVVKHKLPQYYEKPLYFIGFFGLVTSLTIIATWLEGPIAGMAYTKVGALPETLLNVCLATLSGKFLWEIFVKKPTKRKPVVKRKK